MSGAKTTAHRPLGHTGLKVPRIVFGTSSLGNLYQALPEATARAIVRAWLEHVEAPIAIDSAGKYGAGLALEVIGRHLSASAVEDARVVISNKLGWLRVPLETPEPSFEPGVWVGIRHDAEQHVSREGILRCWAQGRELLGGRYSPQLVSVHDPDEYLAAARSDSDRERRWDDIVGAYRSLEELRRRGETRGVGVGSKDWTVIRELSERVELDWVMLANSFTIYSHPPELVEFIASLERRGVGVINSAVFHGGFLVGGEFFDYRPVDPGTTEGRHRLEWRERFTALCRDHDVDPALAGVQFALSPPGVQSLALSSTRPERVAANVDAVEAALPGALWSALKDAGLIARDYPYLG